MRWARNYIRAITFIYILSLLPSGAVAQELPGRIAGTGPITTQNAAPVGNSDSLKRNSETIYGKGTRGPYYLSLKSISTFGEQVMVDGRLLQRGIDYDIDYASGTLAFTAPVNSDIRVEYVYDPAKAAKNSTPINLPLTLDVLKKDNSGVKFVALYKQENPNSQTGADTMVAGLTGAGKSDRGEYNTMFLYSPERPGQGGASDASFIDRSVVDFGGGTKTDNFRLSASYRRVGDQFTGAKDYKMVKGSEVLDISTAFNPSKAILFSSSIKRTENATGDKVGHADRTIAHSLVFTPEGAPKLSISRTEIENERPGAATKTTTTDSIQVDHKINPNVTASATHKTVTAETTGGSDDRQSTSQLVVGAKPVENMSVVSRLTQKDSTGGGKETGIGFDMDASPLKTLSVKAAVNRVDSEKSGKTNTENLKLVANPNKKLNVELNLAHKDSDAAGGELSHAVKVVSQQITDVRMEFGISGKRVDHPADEAARMAKLSTTALKNTTIHLDWRETDSEAKGFEGFTGIRLETTPRDNVKVSGALSQRETASIKENSREARIDVQPFEHTKVGGGIKELESNGSVVTRVTEVNASTKPIDKIEFSGAYKTRDTLNQESLDSLNMALTFDTGGLLKFTGAYAVNPEDKNGAVQRLDSRSIGLRSDFGRVKMKGAFTQKDEYLAGKRSETTELGFDYKLSANSLLTTNYSISERADTSVTETSVYSIGFSKNVGSRLSLYLGGKMTKQEIEQFSNQRDYQAEAKFGVKF